MYLIKSNMYFKHINVKYESICKLLDYNYFTPPFWIF